MAISALCPVQNISSLVFFLEFKKRRERKEREEEEERHTHAHKKRALIFEKEKKRGATLGPIFHFLFFSLLFFGERVVASLLFRVRQNLLFNKFAAAEVEEEEQRHTFLREVFLSLVFSEVFSTKAFFAEKKTKTKKKEEGDKRVFLSGDSFRLRLCAHTIHLTTSRRNVHTQRESGEISE